MVASGIDWDVGNLVDFHFPSDLSYQGLVEQMLKPSPLLPCLIFSSNIPAHLHIKTLRKYDSFNLTKLELEQET